MNDVIPCELDLNFPSNSWSTPENVKELKREKGCYILVNSSDNPYPVYSKCITNLNSKFQKQNMNDNKPCKPHSTLSKTNPNRIALMQERLKCSQLEKNLTRMKNEIKVSGFSVLREISNDILSIFNQNENKAPHSWNCFEKKKKKKKKKLF